MRFLTKNILVAALVLIGLAFAAPNAWAVLTTQVNHGNIQIDLTYHGGHISIAGKSDANVDLILKIFSYEGHEKLMKKEKVAGVVWMNVGELSFDNTPNLYYLRSTKKPEEILSPQQMTTYGIGYDALMKNAEIKPLSSPEEKRVLFDDFIKYKESKKLFSESVGDIDIKPENGGQSYYTDFDWPYQVPPGKYQVAVYAVKDGEVVDTAETEVVVEKTGTVKTLADMAGENGALYGAAAIGVAVIAGFGVGVIFKKGGGAH